MVKVYYDRDADISEINNRKIAIIGYGVQGQAQALNLRDSGCDVVVGNIRDDYYKRAERDGFLVCDIADAVDAASIILFLVPDQAQKSVYEKSVLPNLKSGDMLIFAHGYSIRFKKVVPPSDIDVCLLAPRMPGKPIREYYCDGGGVPVFVDVYQNASGHAMEVLLALAKALGFTKAGAMKVSFAEETELDLFIEHFFLPLIIRSIRIAFDTLTEEGYTPEASLMELYASGEIGELLMLASEKGIYKVWEDNASPTCQYGIVRNSERVSPEKETKKLIREIIKEIKDGTFARELSKEAEDNYCTLKKYNEENRNSYLVKVQDNINKMIKYRQNKIGCS